MPKYFERQRNSERGQRIAPILVLFLLTAFYFLPYVITGSIPYAGDFSGSDLTALNLPLRFEAADQLRQGRMPLWSDVLTNGFPLFAEGQAGVLYPPNWLFFNTVSFPIGVTLGFAFHFFLAAFFTYALARYLGVSRVGSLLAGIAFGFGGFFVFRIKHINMLNAAVWLPLQLLLVERYFSRPKQAVTLLVLAGVFAIQFLAGHPQISYIAGLGVVTYFVVRALQQRWPLRQLVTKTLFSWLLVGTVTFGLIAIQLLPTLELTSVSQRGPVQEYANATSHSYHPAELVGFITPFPHGSPADLTYTVDEFFEHGIFWENINYFGILPLALALLALVLCWRRPVVVACLALIALSLPFIFGSYNPAYPLLWSWFPGLKMFRFPQRFLLPIILSLTVLAGIGYDVVRALIQKRLTGVQWRPSRLLRLGIPAIVILIVMLDLFRLPIRYIGAMPYEHFSAPASAQLLRTESPPSRIYTVDWFNSWPQVNDIAGGWLQGLELHDEFNASLPPDHNVYYGIASVEDRAWIEGGQVAKRVGQLFTSYQSVPEHREDGTVFFPEVFLKVWGMQNVRHFLSFAALEGDGLEQVASFPGQLLPPLRIYANAHALPRAFPVFRADVVNSPEAAFRAIADPNFDPSSRVVVESALTQPLPEKIEKQTYSVETRRWEDGELNFLVNFEQNGLLFLSQTHYPGWQAFVDGKPTSIHLANFAFQAVEVPVGEHQVELLFRPLSYQVGKYITLLTLLLIGAFFGWRFTRTYLALATAASQFTYVCLSYLLVVLAVSFTKDLYYHPTQLLLLLGGGAVLGWSFFAAKLRPLTDWSPST